MWRIYLQQIDQLTDIITRLACGLEAAAKTHCELWRLCTVPSFGPVTAGAIAAFAPDLETFDNGRDFAAWLGLVSREHTTVGKTRLGAVSKMQQCDIPKLLIVVARSVIRWVVRRGSSPDRWLANVVARNRPEPTHMQQPRNALDLPAICLDRHRFQCPFHLTGFHEQGVKFFLSEAAMQPLQQGIRLKPDGGNVALLRSNPPQLAHVRQGFLLQCEPLNRAGFAEDLQPD